VVLAEEDGNKSSALAKKVSQKVESSGNNVLQKVQLQLESLQKKINKVNSDIQKYGWFFLVFNGCVN